MGRVIFTGGSLSMQAPSAGILASSLEVGSSVYLMENGTAAEYLVVHQGNPDIALYDSSCDGTWLLRKDIQSKQVWNSSATAWDTNLYPYSESTMQKYLNNEFILSLDDTVQKVIKTVKIPYGGGNGTAINTMANGLSTKMFILGAYEIGFTINSDSSIAIDGSVLDYFEGLNEYIGEAKRVAYYNGTATTYYLRSVRTNTGKEAIVCMEGGKNGTTEVKNSFGVRPALILPSTAKFDKNTMILKG